MKSIRFALLLLVAAALPARAAGSPARPSDAADFDTTCAPCRDFDQFANGGWKARTKLPAGYSNYGAFDELYDRNEAVLRKGLEAAAAGRSAPPGSDRGRAPQPGGLSTSSTTGTRPCCGRSSRRRPRTGARRPAPTGRGSRTTTRPAWTPPPPERGGGRRPPGRRAAPRPR